jgi:hypothetical protein
VERLLQALDEVDDWVAMLRQRWLRHAAERPEVPEQASRLPTSPEQAPRSSALPLL